MTTELPKARSVAWLIIKVILILAAVLFGIIVLISLFGLGVYHLT